MTRSPQVREILFEFRRSGGAVRVSAVDAVANVEVVVVGPAGAGEAALRQLALDKLDRALGRAVGRSGPGARAPAATATAPASRGLLV